jgi:hypothetical protein
VITRALPRKKWRTAVGALAVTAAATGALLATPAGAASAATTASATTATGSTATATHAANATATVTKTVTLTAATTSTCTFTYTFDAVQFQVSFCPADGATSWAWMYVPNSGNIITGTLDSATMQIGFSDGSKTSISASNSSSGAGSVSQSFSKDITQVQVIETYALGIIPQTFYQYPSQVVTFQGIS